MALPEITESLIRDMAGKSSYEKGYDYFEEAAVTDVRIVGDVYHAQVQGNEVYDVSVWQENGKVVTSCTCPYDWGGICKHVVAVMLSICSSDVVEKQAERTHRIETLVHSMDPDRLREFMARVLSADSRLFRDFEIFAKGRNETDDTAETYKKDVLDRLQVELTENDDYRYEYRYTHGDESAVGEILDEFFETAKKYTSQENYREAVKVYRGICDGCREAREDGELEEFQDDLSFHAEEALQSMAQAMAKADLSPDEKKASYDYLLTLCDQIDSGQFFENIFTDIVKEPEDAAYILAGRTGKLPPPVRFNLLMVKGDEDEAVRLGEAHYAQYPQIAVGLAEHYRNTGQKNKAVETAEKAIEQARDWTYPRILREFLDETYDSTTDYPKIVDNLMMLLKITGDIKHYHTLKETLRSEKDRQEGRERLEGLLKNNDALLFQIYSLENDYEALLALARRAPMYGVFCSVVKKIQDRYPEECFSLYKGRIDKELRDTRNRNGYRQIAGWLGLMKEIPAMHSRFAEYINAIRTIYKNRRALIDELKRL